MVASDAVDRPHRPAPLRAGSAGSAGSALTVIVVGVAAIAIVLVAGFLLFPRYVKHLCIAAAAEAGIALEVERASLAPGVVDLNGVAFRVGAVPQMSGTAAGVSVTLDGLAPRSARARDVVIAIDGPFDEVSESLDAWLAARAASGPGASPTTSALEGVSLGSGQLTWTRAFGQTAMIDARGLTAMSDGRGETLRAVAETTSVSSRPGGPTFGPWRVTLEREGTTERTRIDFDPAIRDGASALWVKTGIARAGSASATEPGATSLKIAVPRSPLARLGVPAASLGLPAETQVEGAVDLERATKTHATLMVHVVLYAARLGGAPVPVDVRIDLSAAGDPEKALDVSRGAITVGPLRATATGTVHLYPDGARLALAWKSTPIPCASLAAQLAGQTPLGALGAELASELGAGQLGVGAAAGVNALAQGLGLPRAKVTGEAHAAGLVTVDTRNLAETTVSMTSSDTCGLTIFP